MRRIVSITLTLIIVTSIFVLGTPIYRYYQKMSGGWNWWEETNPVIADATAVNSWNTGGYIILPATPGYYHVPEQITWSVEISQWIYLSIEFLSFYAHVDAPGNYAIDSLTIQVITNGGINIYFKTGGWLTDVSSPTNKVPTWIGYKLSDTTAPNVGLPSNGSNNSFWYDFNYVNTIANASAPLKVLAPYGGEEQYVLWFGFRIAGNTLKGDYTTYADIYIQSDP